MTMTRALEELLAREAVPHTLVPHAEVYTAREVALVSHLPGREVAKALVARDGAGAALMVVLPAACRLDMAALQALAGRRRLRLATEEELARLFPDCEVGAMPAVGALYGMPVYADACFERRGEIFFQAGNHRELVRMRYADWERLVRPTTGEVCLHAREKSVAE
jgi:Ala-tRNA(Pro) deacylase